MLSDIFCWVTRSKFLKEFLPFLFKELIEEYILVASIFRPKEKYICIFILSV